MQKRKRGQRLAAVDRLALRLAWIMTNHSNRQIGVPFDVTAQTVRANCNHIGFVKLQLEKQIPRLKSHFENERLLGDPAWTPALLAAHMKVWRLFSEESETRAA